MDPFVATQDLRVGMYVHLDLPWMRHPFPRSSFQITSAEQIATIRGLGLQQVRWSPDRSLPAGDATVDEASAIVGGGEEPPPTDHAAADGAASSTPGQDPPTSRPAQPDTPQETLHRLQRQYAQARDELHGIFRGARMSPDRAGSQAGTLSRALVERLLGDDQACIRLLAEADGDHATTHGMNVAVLALLLARSLGVPDDEMVDLGIGALLHDIGKLELPERLHTAPPAGADVERVRGYRDHVALGVRLGQRMRLAAPALTVVAQHHERDDGSGFPQGLGADRIAVAPRIVSLVDRYDNLCNPSRASAALTPHEAMAALFCRGQGHDDPATLAIFVRMMGVYPPGSLVELSDGRVAVVVATDGARPLKPCVRVHDPRRRPDDALQLDLSVVEGLAIRRSLHADALPPAARRTLLPCSRLSYFFESRESATCAPGEADRQDGPASTPRDGHDDDTAATPWLQPRAGTSDSSGAAGARGSPA